MLHPLPLPPDPPVSTILIRNGLRRTVSYRYVVVLADGRSVGGRPYLLLWERTKDLRSYPPPPSSSASSLLLLFSIQHQPFSLTVVVAERPSLLDQFLYRTLSFCAPVGRLQYAVGCSLSTTKTTTTDHCIIILPRKLVHVSAIRFSYFLPHSHLELILRLIHPGAYLCTSLQSNYRLISALAGRYIRRGAGRGWEISTGTYSY